MSNFNITYVPVRSDKVTPVIMKSGLLLTVDGQGYDFSFMSDGDVLPLGSVKSEVIQGEVKRLGDTIHLSIALPHGPDTPESVRFPQPSLVEQDGPIALPGETNAN